MTTATARCAIVGAGRLGTLLVAALRDVGVPVTGPVGRGADPTDAEIVLLCVPDREIAHAAAALTPRPGVMVGHCSGATTLAPLAPHRSFSLHPLMTITADGASLDGVPAAVAGSDPEALETARSLATMLRMLPFEIADEDRAAYHAGVSMASNHLVALEWAAATIAGVPREMLVPIVRATVDNWARLGPERALTGPVARGDEETVARQRAAVQHDHPRLLAVYDALNDTTRALVAHRDHPETAR